MEEIADLLRELIDKTSEVSSTLNEISSKLDEISGHGVYDLNAIVTRLDAFVIDIVGLTRYNLTDIHNELQVIRSDLQAIQTNK